MERFVCKLHIKVSNAPRATNWGRGSPWKQGVRLRRVLNRTSANSRVVDPGDSAPLLKDLFPPRKRSFFLNTNTISCVRAGAFQILLRSFFKLLLINFN